MKIKNIPLLCLLYFLSILFLCFNPTTTVKAAPMTDADVAEQYQHKENTELIISYVLEEKKELILKTDVKDMLDIDALKEELGESNVTVDNEKLETTVTLNKPNTNSFKLFVNNKKPFQLSVLKSNGENIFDYELNQPEKYSGETPEVDDAADDASEAGWTFAEHLRVSEGPIKEYSDGTSTRPYLYFGDYNYAIRRASVSDSYEPSGKSRVNSLTAAGSAILYAEKGSRILDGPTAPGNHIFTDHYGDNQKGDYDSPDIINMGLSSLGIEDRPNGSPRTFISNDLFNYVVSSDGVGVPGTSGPNKLGQSYSMLDTPKFYYRTNPQTGLEEQKIVFKQKAYFVDKKHRPNPEITTTIKLSFNKMGRVVTNIKFKNTGKELFKNFIGFSNHDLSLNEDNKEVTDTKGRRIGNYLKLRTLGNGRGMYMQSEDNRVRTSYFTNQTNGPDAWAARSSSSSYIATKGYSYNPGLIGVVAFRERYYPWKIGKPKDSGFPLYIPTKYHNKKTKHFTSPYVPEHLFNAFNDQYDAGDSKRTDDAGGRLGAAEDESTWDAGLTMRTAPQDLSVGKTVEMEYTSQIDVKGKTFSPVIQLDLNGTDDNPQILPISQNELPLTGLWYDFDSTDVTMYYSIDSEDPEDFKVLFDAKQSDKEAIVGKHHEIKDQKVSLNDFKENKHKLRFYMKDKEGNISNVKEHVIKFKKPATVEPQISVVSPGSSKKESHNPMMHKMTLEGYWNDKDSKLIKSISYIVDDGEEKTLSEDLDNPQLGESNSWKLEDLDIKNCNDFDVHTIEMRIVDTEDHIGNDFFYFRHVAGSLILTAPEQIDFGTISVSPTTESMTQPKIDEGNVILDDYREKDSNPIAISLSMSKFYQEETENHNDEDNGDDSGSSNDPDRRIVDADRKYLLHDVYWKNKKVNSSNIIIGKSTGKTGFEWEYTTDFTKRILKNLRIGFRTGTTGSPDGNYVSHWTWQTVDSIK